ncbi:MAG: hypothetical protein ABII22_00415 [Candidatus Micrarchaeota archaeon]
MVLTQCSQLNANHREIIDSIKSLPNETAERLAELLLTRYKVPESVRLELDRILYEEVDRTAILKDVNLELTSQFRYFVLLLMAKESRFDYERSNKLGCTGLFQLSPKSSEKAMARAGVDINGLVTIEGNIRTWFELMIVKEEEKGQAPWYEKPYSDIVFLTNYGRWPKEDDPAWEKLSLPKTMAMEHMHLRDSCTLDKVVPNKKKPVPRKLSKSE